MYFLYWIIMDTLKWIIYLHQSLLLYFSTWAISMGYIYIDKGYIYTDYLSTWATYLYGLYLHRLSDKESAGQFRKCRRHKFDPWVRKTPWKKKWQPTDIFLPGKFHEQRKLAGYSPWSHKVRHSWACTYLSTSQLYLDNV